MNTWQYHDPEFCCDREPTVLYRFGPWSGLRNFAYDYICWRKPSRIVELGVHYGCSAFAMQQAVLDSCLTTQFFGVDTWQGDAYTRNDYQDPDRDIAAFYEQVRAKYYGAVQSCALRMTFGEALPLFEDESIDLLHIDGSHDYDDVKADFTGWKGKVARDGVIFLHDVGEDLFHGKPMGSSLFWEELKEAWPWTLTLPMSCGLGIWCQGEGLWRQLKEQVDPWRYAGKLFLQDTETKARLREMAYEAQQREKYIESLICASSQAAEAGNMTCAGSGDTNA